MDLVFILRDGVQTGLARSARPETPQCPPQERALRLIQQARDLAARKGFMLDLQVYLAATGGGAKAWTNQDLLHLLRGAGLLGEGGLPPEFAALHRFDPNCAADGSSASPPFGPLRALEVLELQAACGGGSPAAAFQEKPLPEAAACAAVAAAPQIPPLPKTEGGGGARIRVSEAPGATRMGLEAATLSASSEISVVLRRQGEPLAFRLPIRPQAQLAPGDCRLILTATPPEACREPWSFAAEIQVRGRLAPEGAGRRFSVEEEGLACAPQDYELLRIEAPESLARKP